MDWEEQIRSRAHEIWEIEGRPEGRDAEHWARAEAEIDEASQEIDHGGQEETADEGLSENPGLNAAIPAGRAGVEAAKSAFATAAPGTPQGSGTSRK